MRQQAWHSPKMRSMLPIWREAVERVVNRTAETRPEIPENTEKRPCLVQGSISAKLALALFCQIRQNCLTSDGSRGSGIGNPGIGGRESETRESEVGNRICCGLHLVNPGALA